jgi:hypothetical protein
VLVQQHSSHQQRHSMGSARGPSSRLKPGATTSGMGLADAGYDSEASDTNPFEGDALTLEEAEKARSRRTSPVPVQSKARHPRATLPNTTSPNRNRVIASRPAGRNWQMSQRLETVRVMSGAAGAGTGNGLWTVADDEEPGARAGAARLNAMGAEAVYSSQPSHWLGEKQSPRGDARLSLRSRTTEAATQTSSTLAATPAARSVLAAALNDAAVSEGVDSDGGLHASVPVAAAEEGLLRLLVLQRQLHVTEELEGTSPKAALADAAAGLIPRMLQVLEVAKGVCEANHTKLTNFCQERDMDLERLGGEGPNAYLQAQLHALDRLHSQYSSLLPSPSGRPPALPSEDHLHFAFGVNPHLRHDRAFQPGSRSATPTRLANSAGSINTWPDHYSGLGHSASQGQLTASPQPWLQTSPQLAASYSSSVPMLHDPAIRGAPLDPGGHGPSVPLLQGGGGGSTPPPAKFREMRGQASPVLPAGHDGPASSSALGEPLEHTAARRSAPANSEVRRLEHNMASSETALWDMAVGSKSSIPRLTPAGPTEHGRTEVPLALLALQQSRAELGSTRRASSRQRETSAARSIAGGAHAAAGSPSPERHGSPRPELVPGKALTGSAPSSQSRAASGNRGIQDAASPRKITDERPAGPGRLLAGPTEDKYLKILQNLQAKGAVGARGKLLETAGLAARGRKEASTGDSAISSRPWTPSSRPSPAVASSRSGPRRRLAADSESDNSVE